MVHGDPRLRGRTQLSDEVAAHLRERIMSGQIPPGEYIRLDQLAAELEVSVTPVREALAALRGEDMVELQPSRGFRVAPISRRDVEDLFEVQAGLAGKLAARAAVRIDSARLAKLTRVQAELSAAARSGDTETLEQLEYEFHRQINVAADSRKLAWLLGNAARYLPQHFYSGDAGWRRGMLSAHKEILRALRRGADEAASAAMSQHVLDGERRLVKHLDAMGVWAESAEEPSDDR